MTDRPRIENAPGIAWRKKGVGWEATWRARGDLVKRGFRPKSSPLWRGSELTSAEAAQVSDTCRRLQDEMLYWVRTNGGEDIPKTVAFDGSLRGLLNCYQTDPDSTYHKKRYAVRKNHDFTYRRIADRHGHEDIADIKARILLSWHKEWSDGGVKVAMAHAFIGHLRTLFAFGATILEDPECERLCGVLHKMRFQAPKPRTERLTADQAIAVRAKAHEIGWHSIAFAQALQFDLMLRQKDVIGEWVPMAEPGVTDYMHPAKGKWLRGLRWSEIDENMILKHNTSKREKDLEVDLKLAPMVLEEFKIGVVTQTAKGPMIICEATGLPFTTAEFRRKWRIVANLAGIPKAVKNMDSRSGAISEATDAGIDLEHIRHAATHSDIQMTQRYSRGSAEKVANVQKLRAEHRAKPKTTP